MLTLRAYNERYPWFNFNIVNLLLSFNHHPRIGGINMNFVGPFAKAQENAQKFGSSLLFVSSCTETIKVIQDMQIQNKTLEANGDKASLNLNKLDENLFLEVIFSQPIIKDA